MRRSMSQTKSRTTEKEEKGSSSDTCCYLHKYILQLEQSRTAQDTQQEEKFGQMVLVAVLGLLYFTMPL